MSLPLEVAASSAAWSRLPELALFRAQVSWPDLWDLHVHQALGEAASSVREVLWLSRLSGWLCSLGEGACEVCGRKLSLERRQGSMYCDQACAQAARRARLADRPTEVVALVQLGDRLARHVEARVREANRFATQLRASPARLVVMPPDWLAFSDLPPLPEGGCGEQCQGSGICTFTRQTACCFAHTPNMSERD